MTDVSEKCIESLRRGNAADVGEYSYISKTVQDELKRWQERIVEGQMNVTGVCDKCDNRSTQ